MPHAALEATWRLVHETNAELETAEPWKADPGPEVDAVLGSALEALRIVALLASPAMPTTCRNLAPHRAARCARGRTTARRQRAWGGYAGGTVVEKAGPVFPARVRP